MNTEHIVDYTESPFSKVIAKEQYINKLVVAAHQVCGKKLKTPVSKRMQIEPRTWEKFQQKKYIKVLTFHRLSAFCNFPDEVIKDGIKNIDGIENPNIPLNFRTKTGVRLDCGIINEGRTRSRIVEYTNKDKEVLNIIRSAAKSVLGKHFQPSERIDPRDQTVCISFPPYFAKHFVKLGITENKNNLSVGVPSYIMQSKEFCRIWWQANISEEASIYAFSSPSRKGDFYIVPRIQINRVQAVNLHYNFPATERTYYHKDLPPNLLEKLKRNILQLIQDEAEILSCFGIDTKPTFSKLYVNKKGGQTATYSIILSNLKDLRKYYKQVGFELERHRKQFELLLFNRGPKTKEEIRQIMIKFYELVPKYLRGGKKIKVNKWLTQKDKKILLRD